jgi:hypothetical protein
MVVQMPAVRVGEDVRDPRPSFEVGDAQSALPAIIGLTQEWLANRPVPSVRMVIDDDVLEVGRASRNQQRRMEAFLRRHGG